MTQPNSLPMSSDSVCWVRSPDVARLLDTAAVARYLTVDLALDAMRRCFRFEAEGLSGPASRTDLGHRAGWMRVLPAVLEGAGVFGHKVISFNTGVGVRYVITLFDLESGDLRAVVDGEAITGYRTGATAALATDLLSRTEVEVAALIGTGSVARTQLAALQAIRPADAIQVFSRNPDNRREFIEEMQSVVAAELTDCASLDEAYDGADLITLATKSQQPVLSARHLREGVHVNSVGSARPNLMEVAPDAFGTFDRIVCDSVDLVFDESGDAIAACRSGFDRARADSLSELLGSGRVRQAAEITLFKSTGTGLQDLALAMAVLELAEADGAGTVVDDMLDLKRFGPTGRT